VMSRTFSLEDVQHVQSEIGRLALIAGAPTIAVALGLGWWLAGRSLRPINALNLELRQIGPHNLSRRVGGEAAGREDAELRRQINELLQRIEIGFVQLQVFSTHVAHELRSPLQVIRLQMEQAAPSMDPELAESIQAEILRLTAYVDQALALARAEQGREQPKVVTLHLDEEVGPIAADYHLLLQAAGRSLRLRGKGGTALGDPSHLRRILHNLLSNTVRHGQGAVAVRLAGNRILILNRMGAQGASAGVGVGLRLAEALVRLNPGASLVTRRRGRWFLARLELGTQQVG
jgi:signal transduction histidine kinase